jgi:hypothetical protein
MVLLNIQRREQRIRAKFSREITVSADSKEIGLLTKTAPISPNHDAFPSFKARYGKRLA